MLDYLERALERMHVSEERVEFLRDFWSRRTEFWAWQGQCFGDRFRPDALPVFLHGGDPTGRILIMGLNPGYQGKLDVLIEEDVQQDAERYVALHERFFDEYLVYQRKAGGGSPFWNNLHSKLTGMLPDEAIPSDKWLAYRSHCVAQDILPFRSSRSTTSAQELGPQTTLGRVAAASLRGLRKSDARAAWLFSREGFAALDVASRNNPSVMSREHFSVTGCTRTGKHRRVHALVVQLAREGNRPPLPMLAVDNALVTQPTFPFREVYCARSDCAPRLSMADQLRARISAVSRP
ncbi:MAG: hypothetical protein WD557_14385 [Dehalococcoidia bacterium]